MSDDKDYQPAKRVGRPPISDEVCEEALLRMEDGEAPHAVAKDMGYNPQSLCRAIRRDPGRKERYWMAHREASEAAADQARMLAEEAAKSWLDPSIPRGETQLLAQALNHYRWEAERRDPTKWGAKQSLEVSGGMTLSKGPDMTLLTDEQLRALAAIPDAADKVP